MKLACLVAISEHPLLEKCLSGMVELCDFVVLRIDSQSKYFTDKSELLSIIGSKMHAFVSGGAWDSTNKWREEMLTALHESGFVPDVVITLDQDEMFCPGARNEIGEFFESNKKAMMFSYYTPMPTCDGRVLSGAAYPSSPHMKVFKYVVGNTYLPYNGYAQVHPYAWKPDLFWHAETKILHYSFWTKEMETAKRRFALERYGVL